VEVLDVVEGEVLVAEILILKMENAFVQIVDIENVIREEVLVT